MNGELLAEKKNKIRDMWAENFDGLGSPSEIEIFDKDYFIKVSESVPEPLFSFLADPSCVLSEPMPVPLSSYGFLVLRLTISISGLLDHPFGNFCFSYIKLFSIISLFAIPY